MTFCPPTHGVTLSCQCHTMIFQCQTMVFCHLPHGATLSFHTMVLLCQCQTMVFCHLPLLPRGATLSSQCHTMVLQRQCQTMVFCHLPHGATLSCQCYRPPPQCQYHTMISCHGATLRCVIPWSLLPSPTFPLPPSLQDAEPCFVGLWWWDTVTCVMCHSHTMASLAIRSMCHTFTHLAMVVGHCVTCVTLSHIWPWCWDTV